MVRSRITDADGYVRHELDHSQIDERDEISGDEQFVLIWCRVHRRFEWHWIDLEPGC